MRGFEDDPHEGLPKDHISVSQIRLYHRCPEAYRRRYLCGDKIAPSGALVLGKAQHHVQEHNYQQKVFTRTDIAAEEIQDTYADAFDEFAKEAEWGEDKPGESKDWGVQAAALYHTCVAPGVQPLSVEEPLEITLEASGVTLLAIPDVIEESGGVRDTKVIGKRFGAHQIQTDIQVTAYLLALERLGRPAAGFTFDQVVKNKTPVVDSVKATRTKEDFADLEAVAAATVDAIKAGVFPPNIEGYLCTPKFCGYWSTCGYRRAGRSVSVV